MNVVLEVVACHEESLDSSVQRIVRAQGGGSLLSLECLKHLEIMFKGSFLFYRSGLEPRVLKLEG